MSRSCLDGLKEHEEDIFGELGHYDFQNEPLFKELRDSAKGMAKQQLAVSSDSPFSRDSNLKDELMRKLKDERASLLKEETKEIRRQLDIVKGRLNELKVGGNKEILASRKQVTIQQQQQQDSQTRVSAEKSTQNQSSKSSSYQAKTQPNLRPRITPRSSSSNNNKKQLTNELKFRPLTGRADCPNCICDRRTSVCDQCANSAIVLPLTKTNNILNMNEPKRAPYSYNADDRPIRPAKERKNNLATVEVVDEVVVPNKVYTISKSLDEKRTKLAQTIDDLKLIMDQVKERGNKLDKERKLVQLYKDQWKLGPSIGGPSASSRERLGLASQNRRYESRLDPNLARDSKSLMGFRHIESGMRLRQYNNNRQAAKLARKTNATVTKAKQVAHSRSKSLESLNKIPPKTNTNFQRAITNFQNGKSSSEFNLSSGEAVEDKDDDDDDGGGKVQGGGKMDREGTKDGYRDEDEDEDEDEEVEEINVNGLEESTLSDKQSLSRVSSTNSFNDHGPAQAANIKENVQRMTWVPVFGETEVKTIKRTAPKRKVQIMKPLETNKRVQQTNTLNKRILNSNQRKHILVQDNYNNVQRPKPLEVNSLSDGKIAMSKKSINNRPVMVEASRKLKFASDLLEQEHQDSGSRNQLIINKRTLTQPTPKPRNRATTSSPTSRLTSAGHDGRQTAVMDGGKRCLTDDQTTLLAKNLAMDAGKEIARLEEMVKEQQMILNKLTQSQERGQLVVSPVTVRCSSPCHCHPACPPAKGSSVSHIHRQVGATVSGNNRLLVHHLKDRLNKTKTRLARTLEEEREKHQQLRQKVDFSLRKQSDLENENELLKQSLCKCIDTCLKDISNTFESLSDTLTDSIIGTNNRKQPMASLSTTDEEDIRQAVTDSGSVLTNAAQLITDNRQMKQMKSHIETIERQRKGIFDELGKEKQKSNQLELQLSENQAELSRLIDAKRRLESQLALVVNEQAANSLSAVSEGDDQQQQEEIKQSMPVDDSKTHETCQPSTSKQTSAPSNSVSSSSQMGTDKSDFTDTYNSIDIYRQYIQSMSPDLESIRRERKLILSEFDNIKKMLSEIGK